MVRLRCIVEIEGLLTLVTEAVQQTNCRVAQVGTGEGLKRCFDLFSCVCVHGCICVFSSISYPALFLYRLQQMFPCIGQPVFLEAAVGFVGDGVFNKLPVQQLFDCSLEGACFAPQSQYLSQFVC